MNHCPKRPVNLKVSEDLVTMAKQLGINMSATFESALEVAVRDAQLANWRDSNRAAFSSYDKRVEAKGMFSDGKRLF